jgi:hypothetical protein
MTEIHYVLQKKCELGWATVSFQMDNKEEALGFIEPGASTSPEGDLRVLRITTITEVVDA